MMTGFVLAAVVGAEVKEAQRSVCDSNQCRSIGVKECNSNQCRSIGVKVRARKNVL